MDPKIYILHLHTAGLAWIALDRRMPKGRIVDSGRLSGDVATCLSAWSTGKRLKDLEIFLYDSRPQYFSFVVSLPAKAAKEASKIIPLRVRQEIGLGDDAVRWSVRHLREVNGQVELLVFVARNENQDDIAQWRDKNAVKSLWASADLSAIHSYCDASLLDNNVALITELDASAPILYAPQENGVFARFQPDAGTLLPDSTSVTTFQLDFATAKSAFPGASERLAADSGERTASRVKAKLPDTVNLSLLDAVLLGGLFEVGYERPKTTSFFGEVEVASPLLALEKKLKPKPTAMLAASLALVLIGSFAFSRYVRGADTEKVKEQAKSLDELTELYQEQIDVLSDVKGDRLQLIPFIEAVYKVAPADSTLQSLDIAENGLMVIAATTKTQEAGTAFFKDLAASNLFDDIQITYLKLDDGKKWVRLQINAKIRGWKD